MFGFYPRLGGLGDSVVNSRILKYRIWRLEDMISNVQLRTRKALSLFAGALVLPTLAVLIIPAIKVIADPYFMPIAIVYLAAIAVTYVAPIGSEEQKGIRRLLSFFVVALFLSALAVHAIATFTIATLAVHAIATIAVAAYFAPLTTISVAEHIGIAATTCVTMVLYAEPHMTIELAITVMACLAYLVPISEISAMVQLQHNFDVWRQDTIKKLRVLDKAVQMADNPSIPNANRRVNPEAEQHLRRANPQGGLWNFSRAKQILLAFTEELTSWRVNPEAEQHLRRVNPQGGLWNFSRAKQILLAFTEELTSWRRGNAEVPSLSELYKFRIYEETS